MSMPYDNWYFYMFLLQNRGRYLNSAQTALGCVDDGTALEAWSYLQDLYRSGALYYAPASGGIADQLFLEGKTGFFMTSIGSYGGLKRNAKFKLEVAWCPQGKERVVVTGGNSICMLESSKNKTAAWTFLDWLYKDPKGLVTFILGTGYFPPYLPMVNSQTIKQDWAADQNKQIAFEQLTYGNDRNWLYPKSGLLHPDLNVLIEAILFDNKDVKEQIDILNRSITAILK
jgi:ABC-type glycerol-3-phosphate transport system substrate-binding protein